MNDLRLMVYDRTCVPRVAPVGMTTAWRAGSVLYRRLGRVDATFGAASWDEALAWLESYQRPRRIREIQYWGHGRWGRVYIDREALDAASLANEHPLASRISAVRDRLVPDGQALVWLRTCEAFGARAGHELARQLADRFGARVAGHTHIIGALQSGLHGLRPGHAPDWPAEEGIEEGTSEAPKRAYGSGVLRPHTITCFDSEVPSAWFA